MTTYVKLQFRRDDGGSWEHSNPVLLDGEPGYDTTANQLRVGVTGNFHWNDLNPVVAGTGFPGPTGLNGIQSIVRGPTGPAGSQGPAAEGSIAGPTGNTGPLGAASTVVGSTGPRGPTGGSGVGNVGPQGPAGPNIQGPQGPRGPTGNQGDAGPDGPTGATPIPGRFLMMVSGNISLPGTFTISALNGTDTSGLWSQPFAGTVYITVQLDSTTSPVSTDNNYLLVTTIVDSTNVWGYSGSIGTIPTESRDLLFGDSSGNGNGIANVVLPFMYRGFEQTPDLTLSFNLFLSDGETPVAGNPTLDICVDASPSKASVVNI